MPFDPKKNSTIGEFKQAAVQVLKESYPLLEPLPVAIEALVIDNAGNNCTWDPKPHIINATNIDVEEIIGQIGVQDLMARLQAETSSATWEEISYDGYKDNLPQWGTECHYYIKSILWIGEAFNGEQDSEISGDDVYLGMDHILPSTIDITLPNAGTIYVPRMSYVGTSLSILACGNHYEKPRSLLVMMFPFAVITPTRMSNDDFSIVWMTAATPDGTTKRLFPYSPTAHLTGRIGDLEPIMEYDEDTWDITILVDDHGNGYKKITCGARNPNDDIVYYKFAFPEDDYYVTFNSDDNVSYEDPGVSKLANQFIYIYRDCKVIASQKYPDSTLLSSSVYEISLGEMPQALPPVVKYYENYDYDTNLFSNEITDPVIEEACYVELTRDPGILGDEEANTDMFVGYKQFNYTIGTSNIDIGQVSISYDATNPPHILYGVTTPAGPAAVYAQTRTNDAFEAAVAYQDSTIGTSYIYIDSTAAPSPEISPPNAILPSSTPAFWPSISVLIDPFLLNTGGFTVKYAWRISGVTMDPTEGLESEKETPDYDEGNGWDNVTPYIWSAIVPVSYYPALPDAIPGISVTRNVLYVCITKDGFEPSAVVTGEFTIVSESDDKSPTHRDGDLDILSDGYDNKLVCKRIEIYKHMSGTSGLLRFSISPVVSPSINSNYVEETSAETIISGKNMPGFSQTFLATPLQYDGMGNVRERMSCTLILPAKYRKQWRRVNDLIDSEYLDQATEKTQICVCESDYSKINLNVYKISGNTYRYCFSVVDKYDTMTETYPNNGTSSLVYATTIGGPESSIVVTRAQVLQDLDTGALQAVISCQVNSKPYLAYLELTYLSDYYPDQVGAYIQVPVLNETIIDFDTMLPETGYDSLPACTGFLNNDASIDTGTTGNGQLGRNIGAALPQIFINSYLLQGNNLALAISNDDKAVPAVFSYGAQYFNNTDKHCSSALLAWKEIAGRYCETMCFPVVLPIVGPYTDYNSDIVPTIKYPKAGYVYNYISAHADAVWDPVDYEIFDAGAVDPLSSEIEDPGMSISPTVWSRIDAMKRAMYAVSKHFDLAEIMYYANIAYTGTIICYNTPSVTAGNAYLTVGESLTDLGLNPASRRLIYGEEISGGNLMSSRGVYTSSNWPYMSDPKMRVTDIGVSEYTIILDNYIFTIENGYACVYFINEKQGKTLLFNELGSFIDFPIIFKGSPYFGITSGSTLILYKGTENGIIPIHRFDSYTSASMVHISGHNPYLFLQAGTNYETWVMDSIATYLSTTSEFPYAAKIKRVSYPGSYEYSIISGTQEHTIEYLPNSTMLIESSEVYPSMLSYEYEKYTFIVNGMIIRFDMSTLTSGRNLFDLTVKYDRTNTLYYSRNIACQTETKICLDAIPVKSLSYIMTSNTPVRSIRFVGHFVEDLKVE